MAGYARAMQSVVFYDAALARDAQQNAYVYFTFIFTKKNAIIIVITTVITYSPRAMAGERCVAFTRDLRDRPAADDVISGTFSFRFRVVNNYYSFSTSPVDVFRTKTLPGKRQVSPRVGLYHEKSVTMSSRKN